MSKKNYQKNTIQHQSKSAQTNSFSNEIFSLKEILYKYKLYVFLGGIIISVFFIGCVFCFGYSFKASTKDINFDLSKNSVESYDKDKETVENLKKFSKDLVGIKIAVKNIYHIYKENNTNNEDLRAKLEKHKSDLDSDRLVVIAPTPFA